MGGFHRDLNKEMACFRKCRVEKGLRIRVSMVYIRAGHMLWSPHGQFAVPHYSTTIPALATHSTHTGKSWRGQYHAGPPPVEVLCHPKPT